MTTHMPEMGRLFRALADPTRLRILGLLLTGEVCVCHIHESLRIPQSKASRHLAYLRRAGLVETRRDGLWVHYRLRVSSDPILNTVQQVVTHTLLHAETVQRDADRLRKRPGAACRLFPTRRGVRAANWDKNHHGGGPHQSHD